MAFSRSLPSPVNKNVGLQFSGRRWCGDSREVRILWCVIKPNNLLDGPTSPINSFCDCLSKCMARSCLPAASSRCIHCRFLVWLVPYHSRRLLSLYLGLHETSFPCSLFVVMFY